MLPGCLAGDGVCDGAEEVRGFDQLLEDVGLHRQREPIVQHLIQQLTWGNTTCVQVQMHTLH